MISISKIRRIFLTILSLTTIALSYGIGRAQSPDLFAHAVQDHSTAPYFVLVTIVDERSGVSRKICTLAQFLVGAEMTQMGFDSTEAYASSNVAKAEEAIIANTSRVYHFSNPKALANVSVPYSDAQLQIVRDRLSKYSDGQLATAFSGPGNRSNQVSFVEPTEPYETFDGAAAQVLEERGFLIRMADITGMLFIVSRSDLAKEGEEDEHRRQRQLNEIHVGYALAGSLAGYNRVVKEFVVTSLTTGNINMEPYSMFVELASRQPELVDSIWWCDPIDQQRPNYDWYVLIRLYHKARAAASKQQWMADWKRTGPSRSICLELSGVVPHEDFDDVDVAAAWREAHYHGRPWFEYICRINDRLAGEVYLDRSGRHCLLNSCIVPDQTEIQPRVLPRTKAEKTKLSAAFRPLGNEYYAVIGR